MRDDHTKATFPAFSTDAPLREGFLSKTVEVTKCIECPCFDAVYGEYECNHPDAGMFAIVSCQQPPPGECPLREEALIVKLKHNDGIR